MKKPTSPKQIAANRRNAAKSTGPCTSRGRAISRMNAVKHGILSREVLVQSRVHHESAEEFESLHRRFFDDLRPEGALEEMLVDQIVTAHWRLRRALAAESGEISLGIDGGERRRRHSPSPTLQWMQWLAFGDPFQAMSESSIGSSLIVCWLRDLRDAVKREGVITETALHSLAARVGGKPTTLVAELDAFRLSLDSGRTIQGPAPGDTPKAETLAFLDRRIAEFQHRKWACVEEEESEEEARRSAALLPSAPALDKILRYEIKLERQIHRNLTQLERLQRMRSGESLPAPLTVDLSERD